MKDSDFLKWLRNRLVNVYKENPNTYFVHKLQDVAYNMEKAEEHKINLEKVIRYVKS